MTVSPNSHWFLRNTSNPMTVPLACPMTMSGAAAGMLAMRAGKPNSIEPLASNLGHMPPNVMVEATLESGVS